MQLNDESTGGVCKYTYIRVYWHGLLSKLHRIVALVQQQHRCTIGGKLSGHDFGEQVDHQNIYIIIKIFESQISKFNTLDSMYIL